MLFERMPGQVSLSGTGAVVSLEYDDDDEGCAQLEGLVECCLVASQRARARARQAIDVVGGPVSESRGQDGTGTVVS